MRKIGTKIQAKPLMIRKDRATGIAGWLNDTEQRGFEWRVVEVDKDSWGWFNGDDKESTEIPCIIGAWDETSLFFGYLGQPITADGKGDWSNMPLSFFSHSLVRVNACEFNY